MISASIPEVSRMLVEDLNLHHVLRANKPVSFVFMTDSHVQSVPPEGRHDIYFASICAKLAWVMNFAHEQKCEFLVHGGDFINSVAQTANLRAHQSLVSSILNESPLPVYLNIGNHDYVGNMDMVFDSPLGHYIATRALRPFTSMTLKFEGMDVVLAGIPYSSPKETTSVFHTSCQEFLTVLHDRREDEALRTLLFTHQLIEGGKEEEVGLDLNFLADLKPLLVFNGHDHRNLGEFKRQGMTFVQPGAVSRYHNGVEEHTRVPSCALVTVHPDGEVEWRTVVIPHEEANKVFFITAKEVKNTLENVVETSRALAGRVCVAGNKGSAREAILESIQEASKPNVWGMIQNHVERIEGVRQ